MNKLLKAVALYSATVGGMYLIGKFSNKAEELIEENTKGKLREKTTEFVACCKNMQQGIDSEFDKTLGE